MRTYKITRNTGRKTYAVAAPTKTNRINLVLRGGFAPAVVELVNPTMQVSVGRRHPSEAGSGNAIYLADDRRCACVTLDQGWSQERVMRLAKQLGSAKRRDVHLREPVVAMQVIEPGEGWPADGLAAPASLFASLKLAADDTAAASIPVESNHPLLRQPANTLWLMGGNNHGQPLEVPHQSLVGIEQRHHRLLVTFGNVTVAHLLLGFPDEQTATGLKADLAAGLVRLLRFGGVVKEMVLFPHGREDDSATPGYGCLCVGAADGGLEAAMREFGMFADPNEVAQALADRWQQ